MTRSHMRILVVLCVLLAAAMLMTGCQQNAPSPAESFAYTNGELGFAAMFPSKPSETFKENQEVDGKTYTMLHVYGEEGPEQSTVEVQYLEPLSDRHPNASPSVSDDQRNVALGEVLTLFYRFVTDHADGYPPTRLGRMDGSPSATTIFPDKSAGQVMWFYDTAVWRTDGRLYEYRGVRWTEEDAIAAVASFKLLPPGDEQAKPQPGSAGPQIPDGAIEWTEAGKHVGETVTVYGPVEGSTYASDSNNQPTYINIGADYPDASRVSIVVWGEDRHSFSGSPEEMYLGKTISVTGEIYIYSGACYIKVQSPSQVRVVE
jgi:hypothetical protein